MIASPRKKETALWKLCRSRLAQAASPQCRECTAMTRDRLMSVCTVRATNSTPIDAIWNGDSRPGCDLSVAA